MDAPANFLHSSKPINADQFIGDDSDFDLNLDLTPLPQDNKFALTSEFKKDLTSKVDTFVKNQLKEQTAHIEAPYQLLTTTGRVQQQGHCFLSDPLPKEPRDFAATNSSEYQHKQAQKLAFNNLFYGILEEVLPELIYHTWWEETFGEIVSKKNQSTKGYGIKDFFEHIHPAKSQELWAGWNQIVQEHSQQCKLKSIPEELIGSQGPADKWLIIRDEIANSSRFKKIIPNSDILNEIYRMLEKSEKKLYYHVDANSDKNKFRFLCFLLKHEKQIASVKAGLERILDPFKDFSSKMTSDEFDHVLNHFANISPASLKSLYDTLKTIEIEIDLEEKIKLSNTRVYPENSLVFIKQIGLREDLRYLYEEIPVAELKFLIDGINPAVLKKALSEPLNPANCKAASNDVKYSYNSIHKFQSRILYQYLLDTNNNEKVPGQPIDFLVSRRIKETEVILNAEKDAGLMVKLKGDFVKYFATHLGQENFKSHYQNFVQKVSRDTHSELKQKLMGQYKYHSFLRFTNFPLIHDRYRNHVLDALELIPKNLAQSNQIREQFLLFVHEALGKASEKVGREDTRKPAYDHRAFQASCSAKIQGTPLCKTHMKLPQDVIRLYMPQSITNQETGDSDKFHQLEESHKYPFPAIFSMYDKIGIKQQGTDQFILSPDEVQSIFKSNEMHFHEDMFDESKKNLNHGKFQSAFEKYLSDRKNEIRVLVEANGPNLDKQILKSLLKALAVSNIAAMHESSQIIHLFSFCNQVMDHLSEVDIEGGNYKEMLSASLRSLITLRESKSLYDVYRPYMEGTLSSVSKFTQTITERRILADKSNRELFQTQKGITDLGSRFEIEGKIIGLISQSLEELTSNSDPDRSLLNGLEFLRSIKREMNISQTELRSFINLVFSRYAAQKKKEIKDCFNDHKKFREVLHQHISLDKEIDFGQALAKYCKSPIEKLPQPMTVSKERLDELKKLCVERAAILFSFKAATHTNTEKGRKDLGIKLFDVFKLCLSSRIELALAYAKTTLNNKVVNV